MDEALNGVLREMYETGRVLDAEGNEHACFPASLPEIDGLELLEVVRGNTHISRTMEIGMAWGASTLFICEGLSGREGASHVCVDPFQVPWFRGAGLHSVERAALGVPVKHYGEFSCTALPRMATEGRQYDFIFIDGNHRFEHTFVDFFLCE